LLLRLATPKYGANDPNDECKLLAHYCPLPRAAPGPQTVRFSRNCRNCLLVLQGKRATQRDSAHLGATCYEIRVSVGLRQTAAAATTYWMSCSSA
jgi:hypothetical protein